MSNGLATLFYGLVWRIVTGGYVIIQFHVNSATFYFFVLLDMNTPQNSDEWDTKSNKHKRTHILIWYTRAHTHINKQQLLVAYISVYAHFSVCWHCYCINFFFPKDGKWIPPAETYLSCLRHTRATATHSARCRPRSYAWSSRVIFSHVGKLL